MNKHFKIILFISVPVLLLLVITGVYFFLNREDSTSTNQRIDNTSEAGDNDQVSADEPIATDESIIGEVAEALRLECEAEEVAEHYATTYSVCESGNLRFRIDDLDDASADQIQRFSNAINIDCDLAPKGLPVIRNEQIIISSYLVVDHTLAPDLTGLYTQLTEANYQVELVDICDELPDVLDSADEPIVSLPLADSILANIVTALGAEIEGCMDQAFLILDLNIVGAICDNNPVNDIDDVFFTDVTNAEQVLLDSGADALTFAYCGPALKYKLIMIDANIQIFSFDIETTNSIYEILIQKDDYADAKLLDFCAS